MPNGHDYSKEYGGHSYPNLEGTSDCKYGCGCWMGPARSGGPIGLDPFGECPGNPKNGEKIGGKNDYEIVVTRRISNLETQAHIGKQAVEKLEKIKKTPKGKMAEEIAGLKEELEKKDKLLQEIKNKLL